MKEKIEILEVGLRDGLQNVNRNISIENRLSIIHGLIDSGIRNIQVASFVNPKRVPQMACAEELINKIPTKTDIYYSGLVFNQEGVERAIKSNINKIETSISVSESYNKINLGMNTIEAMKNLKHIINMANINNLNIRAGLQCVWGCYYDGQTSQKKILNMLSDILDMGVTKISLCDTSGLAFPEDVSILLEKILKYFPELEIYMHLHNTYGRGLMNLIASMEYKIKGIDTSLGGIGGSPFIKISRGNVATEETVDYLHNNGIETGIDIRKLSTVSKIIENMIGESYFTGELYKQV